MALPALAPPHVASGPWQTMTKTKSIFFTLFVLAALACLGCNSQKETPTTGEARAPFKPEGGAAPAANNAAQGGPGPGAPPPIQGR
jgi:hypothetical protein